MMAPVTAQVEIKTTPQTADPGHLQKATDFLHAYILGDLLRQPCSFVSSKCRPLGVPEPGGTGCRL